MPSETEAFMSAISEAEDGDFITLFHEQFDLALGLITQLQNKKLVKQKNILENNPTKKSVKEVAN